MTQQFRPPPDYESDDTTWPALLAFANAVAMTLRRALLEERAEHAAVVADLRRQIEIYRKLIADFDRQREATNAQP